MFSFNIKKLDPHLLRRTQSPCACSLVRFPSTAGCQRKVKLGLRSRWQRSLTGLAIECGCLVVAGKAMSSELAEAPKFSYSSVLLASLCNCLQLLSLLRKAGLAGKFLSISTQKPIDHPNSLQNMPVWRTQQRCPGQSES